jgi:hypothetical protein
LLGGRAVEIGLVEYRSALLLPPSVQDFVPKDHVSRFNRWAGA